jgi:hypothetical protein
MFGYGVAEFYLSEDGLRMATVQHENDFVRGMVFDHACPEMFVIRPLYQAKAYIYERLGEPDEDGNNVRGVGFHPNWTKVAR